MTTPTLPTIKWIVQSNQLNPPNGNSGGPLFVSKNGIVYLGNAGTNSLPTGTVNHLGATAALTGGSDTYLQKWDTNGTRIWSRAGNQINNGGSDSPTIIFADEDDNVYVSAYMQGTIAGITAFGGRDPVWYKLSPGTTSFTRLWGVASPIATSADNAEGVTAAWDPATRTMYTLTNTNSTVVWGGAGSIVTNNSWSDLVVGKLNSQGTFVWIVQNNTRLGSTVHDYTGVSVIGADGHLVLVWGNNGNWNAGVITSRIMKINTTDGSLIWNNTTVLQNPTHGQVQDIRTDLDSNIYLCMTTTIAITGTTLVGGTDVVIMKLNPSGTRLWAIRPATINTTSNEPGVRMDVDTSGNVYLAYLSAGTVSGQPKIGSDDLTLAKITTNGVVEWVWTPTELNLATQETLSSIRLDKFRNMYIYYSTVGALPGQTPPNAANRNAVLAKLGPVEQISYDPADLIPPTPILTTTTIAAPTITEDVLPNGFSITSILTALGSNLVSPGMNTGIAIYAADTTNGTWQYSINNGGLWTAFPTVSEEAYLLLNGNNTLVRYTPNANSTASTSISYRAWSGQTYSAGTVTAITYGADTPFSEGTATSTLAVTPVNDAPTMDSAVYVLPNLSTLNTDSGVDLLTIMNTFNITDIDTPDFDTSQLGIAILTADTTLGTWEYSETNGESWVAMSSISTTSALHFNIASTTLIRFVPSTTTSVGTTSITFVGWDKTNAASLVNMRGNATLRGGANPYSVAVGTLSRSIIAPPTVPRTIKAIVAADSITFSWTAPIFYGYTGTMTYTIYDASDNVITTTTSTSATISVDTSIQPYVYSISANNGLLEGPKNSSVLYMGAAVLNTIERDHMKLTLNWAAPFVQGTASSITYSILDDNNYLIQSGITDTSYVLSTNLVSGQSYTLKIQANMNGIVTASNTQTAVVPFIPIPTPNTSTLGDGLVTISWNDISSSVQGGSLAGYKLYYRKNDFTEYNTGLITETTTTVTLEDNYGTLSVNGTMGTFSGLENGALYRFKVVAVVLIDSIDKERETSAIMRAIPIGANVSVSNLASSLNSIVSQNDNTAALNIVDQILITPSGSSTVAGSLSTLVSGNSGEKNTAATIFTSLPVSNASSVLQSILETQPAMAAASLLQESISVNSAQVASTISSLDSATRRKEAVFAAVKNTVEANTASAIGASIAAGLVIDENTAIATGAADISSRISESAIKTNTNTVISLFSSVITEATALTSVQKTAIISGAATEILTIGKTVATSSTATAQEKLQAKSTAIAAVLKEANAGSIDISLKNTFIGSVKEVFAGQTIPLDGDAKAAVINSIPSERLQSDLLVPSVPIVIIVPTENEILVSTTTDNQFLAMEINTEYTFKHKENMSDSVTATYKERIGGQRYLDFGSGTELNLGGNIPLFGKYFFLAAAANPIVIPASAPEAPIITKAKGEDKGITITFTAGSDGSSPITNYKYSIDGGATFTAFEPPVTASPLLIPNLTNGVTYAIQIRAVNSIGDGAVSNTVTSAPTGDTNVYVPCIVDGQRILTPDGYKRIETLRNGDVILTPTGRQVPIRMYCTVIESTTVRTAPIRVIGPKGSVLLSPHHAYKINPQGWMIPSVALSIRAPGIKQDTLGKRVVYYHVETPNYLQDDLDVEGLIVESYGTNYIKKNGIDMNKLYVKSSKGEWYERMTSPSPKSLSK